MTVRFSRGELLEAEKLNEAFVEYLPLIGGTMQGTLTLAGDPVLAREPATKSYVDSKITVAGVTTFNTRTSNVTFLLSDLQSVGGATLASPVFTGTPQAPTATAGTNNTQIATTAFVTKAVVASTTGVSSFNSRTGAVSLTLSDVTAVGGAPNDSPTFSGNPTVPLAIAGDKDTTIANTKFVSDAITLAVSLLAPLASPTFTGNPTAPTATAGDNDTTIATTAFVTTVAASKAPIANPTFTGSIQVNGPAGVQNLLAYSTTSEWGKNGGGVYFGANATYNWIWSPDTNGAAYLTNTINGVNKTAMVVQPHGTSISIPNGYLDVSGRVYARGGTAFDSGAVFVATADATYRQIQWSTGGWADLWRLSDGLRIWNSYAGAIATMSGTGVFCAYAGVQANSDGSLAMFDSPGIARHVQFANSYELYWSATDGTYQFYTNGTGHFQVNAANGVCYNYKGAFAGYGPYVDLSDERAKEEIEPATVGLDEILALEPISFRRIELDLPKLPPHELERHDLHTESEPLPIIPPFTSQTEIGFSAQQVRDVMSHAVREMTINLGELGKESPALGVAITPIVAGLVNAMKKVDARLRALEGK